MKKMMMFAIVLTTLLFSQSIASAAMKIGVVDIEKVATELPEFKKSEKEIETLKNSYDSQLQARKAKFDAEVQDYTKQKSMMPAAQQQSTEQGLQAKQMELQKFYQDKFGQQGELNMKRMELLKKLQDKIVAYIEKVSKKEKLNLVLNKNVGILYSDGNMDITYKVLDLINSGK